MMPGGLVSIPPSLDAVFSGPASCSERLSSWVAAAVQALQALPSSVKKTGSFLTTNKNPEVHSDGQASGI